MSKVQTLHYFAAIPGRALKNDDLTALDFRVMMVIAGHDRMQRNGQGCWIHRDKLAARVGCTPQNFSKSVQKLIAAGLLRMRDIPGDARKKSFMLVYEAGEDARAIGVPDDKIRYSD